MFFQYIPIIVAAISSASFAVILFLYARLRSRVKRGIGEGMYVQMSPERCNQLKDSVSARFAVSKEIYQALYMTCDNFPKNREKLGDAISVTYVDGSISGLCNDIVEITNMCENGAIYSLGHKYRLTPLELRTCCFLYWEFKWQQACTVESLTENAYNVRCCRIRKKLALEKDDRIRDFIIRYCRNYS